MGKLTKIGFLLVTVLLVLGSAVLLSDKNTPSDKTLGAQSSATVDAVSDADWVKGNKESKVVLIEYSDLQCPACKVYHPVVKQLTEEFGDRILFVYRHFPLRNIHPNSDMAAQAAEALGKQNKFWEMADKLFENQEKWSSEKNPRDLFLEYARSLGLDVEKFKNDLDSSQVKDKIEKDYQSAVKARVNATPTFFLNGTKLDNPRTYEEFKGILEKVVSNI